MAAAPGFKVGRFILDEQLGQGGMGSVWVATDPQLDRKVAIKLILHARSRDAVARFVREARTAAKLSSPHAVVVYECGEEVIDGTPTPYIAMELLGGEDLKTRLDKSRTLSLDDTARVVAHVAKALAAAHKAGIVHRDIKTDNIMIIPDEGGGFLAKVLDFGIAKSVDSHGITATGDTVGTPQYMSPEQVRGDGSLRSATDLWSLGVVAYRCLTGTFPFSAPSLYLLLPAIVHNVFPPPSSVSESLRALDAWFTRALAKHPDQRFSSALEMSDAFMAAVAEARAAKAPPAFQSTFTPPSMPAFRPSFASTPAPAERPAPAAALETQSVVGTAITAYRSTPTLAPHRSPVMALAVGMGALALVGAVVLVGLKWAPSRGVTTPAAAPEPLATMAASPSEAPTVLPQPTSVATAEPPPPAVKAATAETPPTAMPSATQARSDVGAAPAVAKPKPKPASRRSLGF